MISHVIGIGLRTEKCNSHEDDWLLEQKGQQLDFPNGREQSHLYNVSVLVQAISFLWSAAHK